MTTTGMTFDMKELEKNFGKFVGDIDKKAHEGMKEAGIAFMHDTLFKSPTIPKDEGELRGSMSLVVDDILKGSSATIGVVNKGGSIATFKNSKEGDITSSVALNKPYAAKLHDHPEYNFQEPGSGGNYLTAKLSKFGNDYMMALVNELKKVFK